ncbi:MAG: hypothetical protein ACYSUG_05350 [Planctomycetota bacterium]|jgi:hypothetical protein
MDSVPEGVLFVLSESVGLAALGIDVKYMGKPLTRMLKSAQWQVLTF